MDYKESLLLPKTDFPMRGNLPNNEPVKYKQWDEQKVYDKMKKNRKRYQKEKRTEKVIFGRVLFLPTLKTLLEIF